ncbi:uncharacterized protein N7515_002878 [Penicillium bovifimosum]|uniref:Uncharacterized protein n=1 Tax=Penicillium bovifimosum TaxID=126998 RepID=A0A9W9L9T8_9EURO|nr:uncharacterized protein N7515_002878 [Penicillium bovifimosum]KAJ5144091.1 hypothetical protein N7515_002878 [Penicillium bovifimosum]
MHDTVNGKPETAAFDAVLIRSLTVAGLGVTCTKAHGRPIYCHPCFVLVVVPGPIDRPISIRAAATAATHPSERFLTLKQNADLILGFPYDLYGTQSQKRQWPQAAAARIFLQENYSFLIGEYIFNAPSFKRNSLDWVLCISAVETTSGVIPTLQRSHAQAGFGNTDTLALSTRDTADEIVSDDGVLSVGDTEDGHDDVSHMCGVLVHCCSTEKVSRCSGSSR